MITGFNTDIKFEGVTYHVQTEDKGVKTPLILSLVYQGGTILASKRTPYEDLVAEKFNEKVLEERLNRQHNLICAAIRAGRIEDLKQMTQKSSGAKKAEQSEIKVEMKEEIPQPISKKQVEVSVTKIDAPITKAEKELAETSSQELKRKVEPIKELPKVKPRSEIASETEPSENSPLKELVSVNVAERDKLNDIQPPPSPPAVKQDLPKIIKEDSKPEFSKETVTAVEPPIGKQKILESELETKIPKPTEEPVWDVPIIEDVTIVEDFEPVEEEFVLPPDAVEIVGDLEQFGSLLEDELKVKILGETQFKSGDRKNINILVCRGKDDISVSDANVMVKVIGSDFRPMIYHSKADSNGVATVFLKLPTFRSGRAALIVRAMVDGEETELRRAITTD